MCNIFLRGIQKRFLVTDEYKARMWCSELKWQHESTFTPASNISPIRYVPYLSRSISLTAVQSSVDSGSTLYFPHDHINVKFQCRSPVLSTSRAQWVSCLCWSFYCPPTCTPALHLLIGFGLYTSTETSSISQTEWSFWFGFVCWFCPPTFWLMEPGLPWPSKHCLTPPAVCFWQPELQPELLTI